MGEQRLKFLGTEARRDGHRVTTVAARREKEAILAHRVPGFSPRWGCRGKRDKLVDAAASNTARRCCTSAPLPE